MVLVRNWQFFHVFNLGKIDHENLFHDDGKRKHAFLGYKNKTFKNSKNTDQCFQLRPTRVNKVFSLLNKLNKSKATGLDKISARLIRECADLICIPICDIFNQSISLGIFPDDWKCVRVTPLFKQGDRDDLNNYSPISVISFVANAFERSVYDQLCLFRRTRHHL